MTPFRIEFDARYAALAAEKRKTMPKNVLAAADELLVLDAPVYQHLAGEHGSVFIIGGELRDSEDTYFCDYYQETLRERFDRTDIPMLERKILNRSGIRTDVHEILDKHGLYAEWINPGQVGVYVR